jgi:hypothetical protein
LTETLSPNLKSNIFCAGATVSSLFTNIKLAFLAISIVYGVTCGHVWSEVASDPCVADREAIARLNQWNLQLACFSAQKHISTPTVASLPLFYLSTNPYLLNYVHAKRKPAFYRKS